jgi:tetratricopeptide (TPR) repeat protein
LGYLASHEAFPKARAVAARALELDPELAQAHATLGWAGWAYDWDWVAAERRLLDAEALSPNDAMARYCHALMLAALGRFEDAHLNQRLALDPLSLLITERACASRCSPLRTAMSAFRFLRWIPDSSG